MKRGPVALLILFVAALTLAGGYALKDQCTRHVWDGFQYRRSCYTDVIALYSYRGLDREPIPYIHGDGELTDGEAGDLEYPVGTGFVVAAAASLASDATTFFRITSVFLAIAGLIAVWAVLGIARTRWRVLLFAAAPPVVLYAFHNWDLLAVAAMAVGLWFFARERDLGAGIALGIGTATKLFPGVIVPVLLAARLHRDRRLPWRLGLGAAAAFVAWNLPIFLANPQGWLTPWRFQSTRFPNFETSWYFIYRHLRGDPPGAFWFDDFPSLTGTLSVVLFLVGLAVLLAAEWRRPVFRPYATSLGALLLFLLTAKVYSPQFALWVLPLFALVRIAWPGIVAFFLTDAAVWVAISMFLLSVQYGVGDQGARENLLEVTVWIRYAALAAVLLLSRRAEENVLGPRTLEEPGAPRVDDHAQG